MCCEWTDLHITIMIKNRSRTAAADPLAMPIIAAVLSAVMEREHFKRHVETQ